MKTDAELLRGFAEERSEEAFTELVGRHVDLVYSAALRQVAGDAHLAQDVAQSVFADLARKSRTLMARPNLTGWLYTSACFAAGKLVRGEQRRRSREREAECMNELLRETDAAPDWEQVRPVLDVAMLELPEEDREAVLLRFFEKRQYAEVGGRLGLSENAARMRVDRALDKLRSVLTQRGVTLSTAGLGTLILGNAVQVAPAAVLTSLSAASLLAAATTGTSTVTAMSTLKIGLLGASVAAAALAAPLVMQHQSHTRLRAEADSLRQQVVQFNQVPTERVTPVPSDAANARGLSEEQFDDLLRLRAEVTRLRQDSQELARLKAAGASSSGDSMAVEVNSWLARVTDLKQKLNARPHLKIPELQFLTPRDWLNVALDAQLDTDAGARLAFSRLRTAAKQAFTPLMRQALNGYVQANNGKLPTDLAQLKPHFRSPVEDALLERYQIVAADLTADLPGGEKAIVASQSAGASSGSLKYQSAPQNSIAVAEKVKVDPEFDSLLSVGLNGANLRTEGGSSALGFGAGYSSSRNFGPGTNDISGGFGSARMIQIFDSQMVSRTNR